jgi:hypothetical protein
MLVGRLLRRGWRGGGGSLVLMFRLENDWIGLSRTNGSETT